MAKTYDIVEIIGGQFTYQLYTNLKPNIQGQSTITCTATTENTTFFASFDLSGQTAPTGASAQQVSALLYFNNGVTELVRVVFTSFDLDWPTPPAFSTTTRTFSQGLGGSFTVNLDVNSSYEIRFDEGGYYLFREGVSVSSVNRAEPGIDFADGTSPTYNGGGNGASGVFSNIVLGS
jgi:hypothetical protein